MKANIVFLLSMGLGNILIGVIYPNLTISEFMIVEGVLITIATIRKMLSASLNS